jgi:hypothetical protein
MFFYGHNGRVGVSGYLNLKNAITTQQRDFARKPDRVDARRRGQARALKKESNCPVLRGPPGQEPVAAGDAHDLGSNKDMCVVSASGSVLMVSVNRSAQSAQGYRTC